MPLSISEYIPITFPALAVAHFLALLSPGPDFFLIIGHAVRGKLPGAAFICLGIALGNAIYIALACTGITIFHDYPMLFKILQLIGSSYLIWLGYLLFQASKRPTTLKIQEAQILSPVKQLITGLASALLNVKNAIFYFTLMTVILGPSVTLPQQVFCDAWMTILVLGWDVGLAFLISRPKTQMLLQAKIPMIEKTAGIVLICLATSIVIQLFF